LYNIVRFVSKKIEQINAVGWSNYNFGGFNFDFKFDWFFMLTNCKLQFK
jgi:hypothetical protein